MAPSAEELAKEALGCCKAVEGLGLEKDAREEAEEALLSKDGEGALRKVMTALVAAAGFFDDVKFKKTRDTAVKNVAAALKLFQEAGDRAGEALASLATARLNLVRNRPDAAIQGATQAAEICRSIGDKKGQAKALCTVVDAHIAKAAYVHEGKFVRNSEFFQKSEEEVKAKKQEMAREHLNEALSQARDVADLFRQAADKRSQAEVLCAIADICLSMQDYDEAKESAQTSRDLFTDLEDNLGQQNALNMEVEAHIESGDGVEALSTAEEVVKIFKKSGDKLKEAEALFGCIRVLYMKGDIEEMNKLAKEARALLQRLPDGTKIEGLVLDCMIKAQIASDQIVDAVKTAKEAVAVYKKGEDKPGEAAALHSCACISLDKWFKDAKENQKDLVKSGFNSQNFTKADVPVYKEAIEMVEKAYEIYSELGDKAAIELVSDTMANINIRATMLNEPDETRQIAKGHMEIFEIVEIWNKTEIKLEVTRDGKDPEKIKKTKYEVVPMEKKESAAVEDDSPMAEIAG
jgi:tetratricopeptide (TPR) repeat protein